MPQPIIYNLFSQVFLVILLTQSSTAWATDGYPIFEVEAETGGRFEASAGSKQFSPGGSILASAQTRDLALRIRAWYGVGFGESPSIDIRIQGNLAFLHLYEYRYQRSELQGVSHELLAGSGSVWNVNLSDTDSDAVARFALSMGIAALETIRPEEFHALFAGAYIGTDLQLVYGKFQGELKLAWVVMHPMAFPTDYFQNVTAAKIWENSNKGIQTSINGSWQLWNLGGIHLGPELQLGLDQLPDGTFFTVRAGLRANL